MTCLEADTGKTCWYCHDAIDYEYNFNPEYEAKTREKHIILKHKGKIHRFGF